MVRLVLCVEFRIYNIEMRKVGIAVFIGHQQGPLCVGIKLIFSFI